MPRFSTRPRDEPTKNRILGQASAKMELPSFIETGSAPECVSRRSSIAWRSSSPLSTVGTLGGGQGDSGARGRVAATEEQPPFVLRM